MTASCMLYEEWSTYIRESVKNRFLKLFFFFQEDRKYNEMKKIQMLEKTCIKSLSNPWKQKYKGGFFLSVLGTLKKEKSRKGKQETGV